jgi:hypothetical protein
MIKQIIPLGFILVSSLAIHAEERFILTDSEEDIIQCIQENYNADENFDDVAAYCGYIKGEDE